MTNRVFIIGAGGHAKVAIASAEAAGIEIAGIFDDDPAKKGTTLLGHTVEGPIPPASWWQQRQEGAHLAIGSNRARQKLASQLKCRWTSIVHPAALVHATAKIGAGTLVCARVVIHPDAIIGRHCIVNTAAVVEHDCVVGDFVHLAPMSCLAGGVRAGEGAFIGMGASIIPERTVGSWAIVGAGAAVIGDIAAGATVAGVPAKPVRQH